MRTWTDNCRPRTYWVGSCAFIVGAWNRRKPKVQDPSKPRTVIQCLCPYLKLKLAGKPRKAIEAYQGCHRARIGRFVRWIECGEPNRNWNFEDADGGQCYVAIDDFEANGELTMLFEYVENASNGSPSYSPMEVNKIVGIEAQSLFDATKS